jgi:hypothetical protein
MCDYKKLKHPEERPETGGADYQVWLWKNAKYKKSVF